MLKTKNKAEVYIILEMVENIQEHGLMENNLELVYYMKMKNNLK